MMRVFSAIAFVVCTIPACTDNPFESDAPVSGSHRRLSGSVTLSNQGDHSGVYLWLEGFGTATRSAEDGRFVLTLPPAISQSTTGGVSGTFNLYAFLGNYRTAVIRTAVKNGAFSLPTESIDENGILRSPMFMQELFSIETILSRDRIEADSPRTISMTVRLRSNGETAEVYFPRSLNGVEGPIVLHNLVTGEARVLKTVVTGIEITDYVKLGIVPYTRSLMLIIPAGTLKTGRYEILAYILPKRHQIPLALLNSLAADASELGPAYVHYPMLRKGGILSVSPE